MKVYFIGTGPGAPDQRIVEGTVLSIASLMEEEKIERQALVLVGSVLKAAE
jgi:precorrin-4 methylase